MKNEKLKEEQMVFASATTTKKAVAEAIQDLVTQVEAQIEGRPIDFVLAFLSPHFRLVVRDISARLRNRLGPRIFLGCTGEGVIGSKEEIEEKAAITLMAAHLPNVELKSFALQATDWEEALNDRTKFQQMISAPDSTRLFVMVADPFTTPIGEILEAFNIYYSDLPVIGGMASGAQRAGGNALLLEDQVLSHGAVGLALAGPIDIDVIVSQGCRPIGRPFKVTAARDNVIMSLEGQVPLIHLQDMIRELSDEDRQLLQNGLFIGRAIDADREPLGRGDFLIRAVVGLDENSGEMVIGDYVDPDETVQFHIRDATTATEDLEMMLTPQLLFDQPSGGLLFSCNGRGRQLYKHANGDISTMQKAIGDIDLAGFFCAGEIGPIGGKNFLHGHTASLVLFRPEEDEPVV